MIGDGEAALGLFVLSPANATDKALVVEVDALAAVFMVVSVSPLQAI